MYNSFLVLNNFQQYGGNVYQHECRYERLVLNCYYLLKVSVDTYSKKTARF